VRGESLDSARPEMRQTLDRAEKFLSLVALLAALLSAGGRGPGGRGVCPPPPHGEAGRFRNCGDRLSYTAFDPGAPIDSTIHGPVRSPRRGLS